MVFVAYSWNGILRKVNYRYIAVCAKGHQQVGG